MNSADRQRKKMIVLGHDASRTGAPIFLLHLTEWLKRHGAIDFEIILKQGGPLLAEFQKIAPTTVLAHTRAERLIHRCCQLLRCPTPARFPRRQKSGGGSATGTLTWPTPTPWPWSPRRRC